MRRLAYIVPFVLAAAACKAEIGDACSYDIDCSANMDRTCDSVQPGGYCLILSCDPDECPGEAVCVEFTTPCPDGPDAGEDGYEDYQDLCDLIEPNRGRTYCLRRCRADAGCRSRYQCVLPQLEADLEERTSDLPVLENASIVDFDVTNPDIGFCVPRV